MNQQMRILLLVDCYIPYSKSSATQMRDLAVELRDRNHDVIVLTPSDRIVNSIEVSREEGLRVVRVKTRKIKGASKVFRALEEARLSSLVWRRARRFLLNNRADLIAFYSPTIFWGGLVRRLKSGWGCPTYLILRDIFPAWAVDAGLLSKGPIYSFFRKKEVEQYEAADRIAVQSPANLQYFTREFKSRRYPLEVLYNWISLRAENLSSMKYRKALGLGGKIVFFYGGNIGVAQDLDNIIRLAVRLADHDHICFVLVGEGSEESRLKRLIAEKNLRNIQILSPMAHQEYLAMIAEFDVGLLSLDQRLKTHNVPGKLLCYMHGSKPTLASVNPGNDLFGIIEENRAGFCIANGDDENLCAAALTLANDPELRAKLGANSRRLLERLFSVNAAASQIVDPYQPQMTPFNEKEAAEHVESLYSKNGF